MFTIDVDYDPFSEPRWLPAAPNTSLLHLIEKRRPEYIKVLQKFDEYSDPLKKIPLEIQDGTIVPGWINGWLPGLDSLSICAFLAERNPAYYLEIGSGHSTRFARKAISEFGLRTKIISIDPRPRTDVDDICDENHRTKLEHISFEVFDRLNESDMVFFDGSHRVFMNSDATTFFIDILPRIQKGPLIGIHDIFLPSDYPSAWIERYYSEQYLLAAWLLADQGRSIEIDLPCAYVTNTQDNLAHLKKFWGSIPSGVEKHGCCFWFHKK